MKRRGFIGIAMGALAAIVAPLRLNASLPKRKPDALVLGPDEYFVVIGGSVKERPISEHPNYAEMVKRYGDLPVVPTHFLACQTTANIYSKTTGKLIRTQVIKEPTRLLPS